MKKLLTGFVICVFVLGAIGISNAALIQITGNSAASGELGWFVVDDTIFSTDTSLQASQFYSYYWDDPNSDVLITPANVPSDTGVTYFSWDGNVWTVTGGGADSLTVSSEEALWIAGSNFVWFRGGSSYNDVKWSTTSYTDAKVPEPASMLLLGFGLMGLAGARRLKK